MEAPAASNSPVSRIPSLGYIPRRRELWGFRRKVRVKIFRRICDADDDATIRCQKPQFFAPGDLPILVFTRLCLYHLHGFLHRETVPAVSWSASPLNADMHAVPAQCRLERVILCSSCFSRWTRKRLHAVSVTLVDMRTSRVLLNFGAAFCSVVLHQGNLHGNHWRMLDDGLEDLLRLPRSHPSSSSFTPRRRQEWVLGLPSEFHCDTDSELLQTINLSHDNLRPSWVKVFQPSGLPRLRLVTRLLARVSKGCSAASQVFAYTSGLEIAHVKSSYDQKGSLGSHPRLHSRSTVQPALHNPPHIRRRLERLVLHL